MDKKLERQKKNTALLSNSEGRTAYNSRAGLDQSGGISDQRTGRNLSRVGRIAWPARWLGNFDRCSLALGVGI
tara:strand:+ start:534 stop:752 length:219 start_codon:yes stop_codon:yes gene_type:complete